MKVIGKLIPIGHPNRPGIKLTALKALIFHYTGNDSPDATDTMNAAWFGRKYIKGIDGKYYEQDGKVPFGYGSTQIIADEDSVTMAIPTNESAYACGDRHVTPWTPENKGQQKAAQLIFGNRQNFQSVSIEICNNADWEKACNNATEWAIDFLKSKSLKVNLRQSLDPQNYTGVGEDEILLLRHFDLTGKNCPAPFVKYTVKWVEFIKRIAEAV